MKFAGKIGFYEGTKETKPSVYKPVIVERVYIGDVIRNARRFQSTEYQNETTVLSNQISIIADLYFQKNLASVRYVEWMGVKWRATVSTIDYPRVTIDLGGVWNG